MKRPNLRSQGGQLIMEAVILMVILVGVALTITKYFTSQEVLHNLISGPWKSLAGMMQNGEWGTPDATDAIHPNAHNRHVVILGEHVQ